VEVLLEVDRVSDFEFIDESKISASRSFPKDRQIGKSDNSLSFGKETQHENE
jgi:hypothetical protein